jgi:hypothetical protein
MNVLPFELLFIQNKKNLHNQSFQGCIHLVNDIEHIILRDAEIPLERMKMARTGNARRTESHLLELVLICQDIANCALEKIAENDSAVGCQLTSSNSNLH